MRFLRRLILRFDGVLGIIVFWGAGMALSCLLALMAWRDLPPVSSVDSFLHDRLVRQAAYEKQPTGQALVVDVDDDSLAAVGQWPWPRYRVAALVRGIMDSGAAVVGLDVIFPESDRASLLTIKQTFQREFGLEIEFKGVPQGLDDNDGYLGYVLKDTHAVGSMFMYFDHENIETPCWLSGVNVSGVMSSLSLPDAPGILCNTPKIQQGLLATGFMNNQLDTDGSMRSMQLLVTHKRRWYPSLTLATLMQALNVRTVTVEEDFYGPVLVVGEKRIPIDEEGRAVLAYTSPHAPKRTVSAVDVLTGAITPETFAGKIVFIGSTAAGLNDLHHTPVGQFSGVEAHAVLTENVLSGTMYRKPVWRKKYAGITTVVAGFIVSCLFVLLGPAYAAVASVVVGITGPLAGMFFFAKDGVLIPVAGPLLTSGVLLLVLSQVLYARERYRAYRRLQLIGKAHQTTLEAMAAVAETRDPETGAHIKRTQHYVRVLARCLDRKNIVILSEAQIDMLFHCAPLHDIGKVGVPDRILKKKGPLDDDEFALMKEHVLYGKEIIETARQGHEEEEFFLLASEIAYSHHEKWDGSGYPLGLKGEEIPLAGRLMALADVYDALISQRHYKAAFSHEKACEIISEGRGTHFDPQIVDCFWDAEGEFIAIAEQFKDDPIDLERWLKSN